MKAKADKPKGRCWKGCKPVPGKKPYSKGSCSCGMSALTPGMIELAEGRYVLMPEGTPTPPIARGPYAPIARPKIYATPPRNAPYVSPYSSLIKPKVKGGLLARLKAASRFFEAELDGPGMIEFVSDEGRAAAAATLRYNRWIDQNPKVDYGKNPHLGDVLATEDRVQQRGISANKMGWPFGKKARARRVERKTYNEDIDYINNQLKGMAALTPAMIEFARGDRAIPALKKALAKGIGNAGERVSISEIGVSGTMVPSLRGNAKNVQRATKKYWGEDEGLGQATGAMRYNRDWAAKTIKEDRSKRYMWPRRLRSEDSLPEPMRKARARSRMGLPANGPTWGFMLSALTPGMVAFALGEDNRPRNNNGQFLANETGGADPNSMAAAYGNVEAEKMERRRGLAQRMRSMMGYHSMPDGTSMKGSTHGGARGSQEQSVM